MKNILFIGFLFIGLTSFAKTITAEITVKGNCDMCKERIEKALDQPGISFAQWDVKSKVLTVRYNDKKVTEDQIHQIIADLGHSTEKVQANKTSQANLPKCCQPVKASCGSSKGCCKKKS